MDKKWLLPLIIISFVCTFFLCSPFNMGFLSLIQNFSSMFLFLPSPLTINQTAPLFVETKISPSKSTLGSAIPRFAYLISGSKGDSEKLWRTLLALYHPLNHYIVHLDRESPLQERLKLASRIGKQHVFNEVGNVFMIQKGNMVTYRGPTMVANTLHACSIMLNRSKDWDWFINLSASDYPLVTQDDLLYTFSDLDRSLNFVEHSSQLGWKLEKRAKPLIIDPGLYMSTKSDVIWVNPMRTLPTAFKLFTGSAWMVLSREFVEYVVWGWDNLPRTLLMYYANFISSPEGYFQSVVCNMPELTNTVVNSDLHYISWDIPPKQHPHVLNINDTDKMVASNAAFARKFKQDDQVLDVIDKKLLNRVEGMFTPGGWCSGKPRCSKVGNVYRIRPGPGSLRLRMLVARLTLDARLGQNQCK